MTNPAALKVAAASLVLVVPFLFSPPPDAEQQAREYVSVKPIGSRARLVVAGDSYSFIRFARKPALLLSDEFRLWQSRPGYVLLGWAIHQPLRAAARLLGPETPGRTFTTQYAAFIVLNALLLVSAVFLFLRMLDVRSFLDAPVLLLPIAVVVCNPVTKAFFWTPHPQMFNVLVPLAAIAVSAWLWRADATYSAARMTIVGALLGLGSLAYGLWLVAAGVAALTVLIAAARSRGAAPAVLLCGALAAGVLLPVVLWYGLVLLQTGGLYSHEVARYRQFVWVIDALRERELAARAAANLRAFGRATLPAVAVAAVAALAAETWRRHTRPSTIEGSRALRRSVVLFLAVDAGFLAAMGYYQQRLSWSLAPALLVLVALALREAAAAGPRARRLVIGGQCAAAGAWAIALYVSRGHYL